MSEPKPKRSKRDIWFKFGRFITGVTIACFFLPFFGVSCEGMDVLDFSGTDMVGGCKPGGMAVEMEKQKAKDRAAGVDSPGDITIPNVKREPLAIAALGLAIVVAGLSWVRSRGAMIAALALSLACVGALAGLYVKVNGDMASEISGRSGNKNAGSKLTKDIKIDHGSRFGLWLTIASLLGVAVITGLALKEKEGRYPLSPG